MVLNNTFLVQVIFNEIATEERECLGQNPGNVLNTDICFSRSKTVGICVLICQWKHGLLLTRETVLDLTYWIGIGIIASRYKQVYQPIHLRAELIPSSPNNNLWLSSSKKSQGNNSKTKPKTDKTLWCTKLLLQRLKCKPVHSWNKIVYCIIVKLLQTEAYI